MENKVYISAPISLSWSTVSRTKEILESHFGNVSVWDRDFNNYRPGDFGNANIVVFCLPGLKFSYEVSGLPVGVRKEVKEAISYGKQMYIAYVTSDGFQRIYKARLNGSKIEGIAGTSDDIFTTYLNSNLVNKIQRAAEKIAISSRGVAMLDKTWTTDQGVTSIPNPDYVDQRILLMM